MTIKNRGFLIFAIGFAFAFGFLMIGGIKNAYADNNILDVTFHDNTGYNLNLYWKYFRGSDCRDINSNPYNPPSCDYLETGGVTHSGIVANGFTYFDEYIIGNPALQPPNYYVWWYATYTDGSWCVDPTTSFNEPPPGPGIGVYVTDIFVNCTSPPPPPPPGSPSLNNPSQQCNLGSASLPDITFSWNASANTDHYRVLIWNLNGDSQWAMGPPVYGISFTWQDLPNNSGVTWAVEAYNAGETQYTPSALGGFTTSDCSPPIVNNPPTGAFFGPANGASVDCSATSITGWAHDWDVPQPYPAIGVNITVDGVVHYVVANLSSSNNDNFSWALTGSEKNAGSHTFSAVALDNKGDASKNYTIGSRTYSCQTVTLSGYVRTNTGTGISGVVINSGSGNNPCGLLSGTATTSASGFYQFTNIPKGLVFCLRAPSLINYQGPDGSYECQTAGKFVNPDTCGTGRDVSADNAYNFVYVPIIRVINVRVFNDKNGDGIYNPGGAGDETFNSGGNVMFNPLKASIYKDDGSLVNVTGSIGLDGYYSVTAAFPSNTRFRVNVQSGWGLTKYYTSQTLLAPVCNLNTACSYNATFYTGYWSVPSGSATWTLYLGIKAQTATMNVVVFNDIDGDGVKDSGEDFNSGGNPQFGSGVAVVNKLYFFATEGTVTTDITGVMSSTGTAVFTVGASSSGAINRFYHYFQVVPAGGWQLTKYRSDQSVYICGQNTSCDYRYDEFVQGGTWWRVPAPGETFTFYLGIQAVALTNPGNLQVSVSCPAGVLQAVFTWNDNAASETAYYVDVTTGGSSSLWPATWGYKTTGSFTGAGSFTWKDTAVSSDQLTAGDADPGVAGNQVRPAYSKTYRWRVTAYDSTRNAYSGHVYPANTTVPTGTSFSTPVSSTCTPPANPSNLVVSSSCFSGILTVYFSFTDNATNESGYILDVSTGGTSSSWASTWGGKYLNTGPGQFVWKNTSVESDLLSFPDADPNTTGNQVAPDFGKTYRWRVVAYNVGGIESAHIYPVSTTTPTGVAFTTPTLASCSAPANPTNPIVLITCPSGLPSLEFRWTDNANNDTEYYLDINGAAWTGDSSPSPWGVKTLAGNGATTGAMSWTWSSASSVDSGGDTDPVIAGNQLTPQNNKTYYWRLIARNNSTTPALYSSHVYPNGGAGTTTWPGSPINAICGPDLVIVSPITVPNGNIGATINATVPIRNDGNTTAANFKVAVNMDEKAGNNINCPPSIGQSGTATVASLASGASTNVTVPVPVPAIPATYTARAMVDADCQITEILENNNLSSTVTYTAQGFDLSTTVVGLDRDPANYKDSQTAKFKVSITNNGNIASPASGIYLGVWPKGGIAGGDTTAYPSCPGTSSTAPADPVGKIQNYSVGALNPGQTVLFDGTVDSQYSFNVGNVPGSYTLKSYVIYNCAAGGGDANWSNNGSDCVSPCPNINKSYSVAVDSFFEGSGGDVGSQGNILVSRNPMPIASKQSNYLVAGTGLSNVQSPWQITNYDQRQVPTIVYPYLKEKFYNTAKEQTSICDFGSHRTGSTPELSANYCNGRATYGAGSNAPSGVAYWFVDGSLDVTQDVVVSGASSALAIVVRDDVFIHTNVKRVDAVIVAGQTFHAQTGPSDFVGPQLGMNGAVYTNQSDLKRILGGGAGVCGSICDNSQYPAIKFNLDPKYLVLLLPSFGTPSLGWKEVAP